MLPRDLSDNLCSLRPNERRPVLVCRVTITEEGTLSNDIRFSAAWVESKPNWFTTMSLTGWKEIIAGSHKIPLLQSRLRY